MLGGAGKTTLTTRVPEDTALRSKQLVASGGINSNKLLDELGASALAVHDAETRFPLMANAGDREAALDILARIDERDRQTSPWDNGRL
jgi:hypothetical protein